MTRDFSLSSVLRRMGGAGGSGCEIGAVLTCHSPRLAMNFPKQHYIRFCQNVCRDQVKLSQQRTEPINFMDRQYFDDDEESDSGNSDQDFPQGRR